LDSGRLGEPLSESWFKERFMDVFERNGRAPASMAQEYYLRLMVPLDRNFQQQKQRGATRYSFNFSWLHAKHAQMSARGATQAAQTYTFEEDLALCLKVVERGAAGRALTIPWFVDNVVGHVPEVEKKKKKKTCLLLF
jgi:hypothetical protein